VPAYCLWFIPLIALGFVTERMKDSFPTWKEIVQRIYQALECLLMFCFYNYILRKPRNKKLIKVLFGLFIVIVVVYYLFYRGSFNVQDYFDYIVESFFICLLVSLFFLELLDYRGSMRLHTFPAFWINAVNLLFYGGNFFAMGLYEKISNADSALSKEMANIPKYLNLVLYAAYLIIFALARKKQNHVN
jgi:hypothetical protein